MKNRPIVVSIIAILLLFNGILTVANGIRFEAHYAVLIYGAAALILSVGMWMLWPWAWAGIVIFQVIAIGYALYDWFSGGPIDFLAMILGAIVLIYMLRRDTREVFFDRQPASADSSL